MSPEIVDNHGMGTIFEYLIRKFKEASNEAAGQFYTPRDIIGLLMKGEDPENIKRENTISHDLLPGKQFNYMLSNPLFGKDWKNIQEEIEAEHERGEAGRYGPGLPDVGDGAMLFLLHKLSKLPRRGGKIAIFFNGSPLFNGDAGSGPSNIRKHLLQRSLRFSTKKAFECLPAIAICMWRLRRSRKRDRYRLQALAESNREMGTLVALPQMESMPLFLGPDRHQGGVTVCQPQEPVNEWLCFPESV